MAESERFVKLVLNQQQLELLDATIDRVGAADRENLVRIALREYFDLHGAPRLPDKTKERAPWKSGASTPG